MKHGGMSGVIVDTHGCLLIHVLVIFDPFESTTSHFYSRRNDSTSDSSLN